MTEISDPPLDPADQQAHRHGSPVGGSQRRSGLPEGARAFFDWIVVVGVALLVAILVRTFLLAHFVVEGTSMYSTLDTGDRVFVNKMSFRLHDPNRGDVVVLHEITGATERDLIKRVIALPGEEIRMENCEVFIDSDPNDTEPAQRLVEPYLDPTVVTPGNCGQAIAPITIPADEVFVMGDNRAGSQDSRAIGSIAYDDLVGRAFVVFWPKSSWQWL
ncbi:MAG: signal peptidase I [Ilumatobacteraceae bacterium]